MTPCRRTAIRKVHGDAKSVLQVYPMISGLTSETRVCCTLWDREDGLIGSTKAWGTRITRIGRILANQVDGYTELNSSG